MKLLHLEGAWIDPTRRKKAGVGRALLRGMIRALGRHRGWALASTEEQSIERLFVHMGATPLFVNPEARAFAVDVGQVEEIWQRHRMEEEAWAS